MGGKIEFIFIGISYFGTLPFLSYKKFTFRDMGGNMTGWDVKKQKNKTQNHHKQQQLTHIARQKQNKN